jgi:hypothetical protein
LALILPQKVKERNKMKIIISYHATGKQTIHIATEMEIGSSGIAWWNKKQAGFIGFGSEWSISIVKN